MRTYNQVELYLTVPGTDPGQEPPPFQERYSLPVTDRSLPAEEIIAQRLSAAQDLPVTPLFTP